MQVLASGHKRHLEHCTGHKRKQDTGTVEIEGLDELEAEEEERLASFRQGDDEEQQDPQRPVQVCVTGCMYHVYIQTLFSVGAMHAM